MSRQATRLVESLGRLGYVISAASSMILRFHGQPMMNKAAGEAAPCWELRVNVMRRHNQPIDNGERPRVRTPAGEILMIEVCSYMPLGHLLRQPLSEWDIEVSERRLTITTQHLPDSWT